MIDYQEVLEIHQVLIRAFGGSQGVRDENGLKSAVLSTNFVLRAIVVLLTRPSQTFFH